MSFWRAAGFSYLQYTNIGARTLRSILVPEAKAIAIKREEIALKRAIWSDGKMGDSVIIAGLKD